MTLARRLVGESLGTAFLLVAVVGSGIMAERLSGGNDAIALLANSLATGGALVALIVIFAPVSGAHFNPAVTVALAARGELPLRPGHRGGGGGPALRVDLQGAAQKLGIESRRDGPVMISGLVQILLFQGLGELITHFLLPLIPGPVIGLILLLGFLALRRSVNASLDEVASTFSQHFGLLFVPAAVGVVMFWPQLKAHALAIAAALVVSVVLTIAVTALVLKALSRASRK